LATEKPFLPIAFTLDALGDREQYETAGGACLYIAQLNGSGLEVQFDENDPFPVDVGNFIRVQRFDKLRLINNSGIQISGVIYVSSDPDFLFLRGI
jgi:hypothetical protein